MLIPYSCAFYYKIKELDGNVNQNFGCFYGFDCVDKLC